MHIIKEIIISNDKPEDKVLLVYKDIGETSHDVVDQVRKIYGTRKVGHAGALDPFAKGMLIVGIHGGTKAIWKFEDQVKGYNFEMILGIKTLSGDHQEKIIDSDFDINMDKLIGNGSTSAVVGAGIAKALFSPDSIGLSALTPNEELNQIDVLSNDNVSTRADTRPAPTLTKSNLGITKTEVETVFHTFPKIYPQQVPLLSSVKVHGHKLRELVRSCEDVEIIGNDAIFTMHDGKIIQLEIPIKEVTLEKLELKNITQVPMSEIIQTASLEFIKSLDELNLSNVNVLKISGYSEVSKGTFIRKLAEDIAEKLNTFAFLSSLERVKCGEYKI